MNSLIYYNCMVVCINNSYCIVSEEDYPLPPNHNSMMTSGGIVSQLFRLKEEGKRQCKKYAVYTLKTQEPYLDDWWFRAERLTAILSCCHVLNRVIIKAVNKVLESCSLMESIAGELKFYLIMTNYTSVLLCPTEPLSLIDIIECYLNPVYTFLLIVTIRPALQMKVNR